MTAIDLIIRQLIGGDQGDVARITGLAGAGDEPIVLVAAALIDPATRDLLVRAMALSSSTRDRQLTAIAAAHVDRDAERVDALARDHLADHPDSFLVAWIAAISAHPEGTPS